MNLRYHQGNGDYFCDEKTALGRGGYLFRRSEEGNKILRITTSIARADFTDSFTITRLSTSQAMDLLPPTGV